MNDPRKPDENLQQYHDRLKQQEQKLQQYLKGASFWDSQKQGTYKKT